MKRKDYSPLVWFVLGFGTFVFTRMSKLVPTIPIAILIAPVFILRFSREQPVLRGNLLTLLGFYTSINIGLWWLYESNIIYNAVKILLLALLYALPFMIDRFVYERLTRKGIGPVITSLAFPIIATAIHYLSSLEGFFEGTIQISKFVFGPAALLQLLSLFGICGYIFLVSWFAAVVNTMWEAGFEWNKIKRSILIFSAVVLAFFAFGAVKISSRNPEEETVKVAAVILKQEEGYAPIDPMWEDRLVSPFTESISTIENLTRTAALDGAEIVTFQEFSMMVDEKDEPKLWGEYERIARENGVYLSISYATYADAGKGENIHLLIDSEGEVLRDYEKRYVTGISELNIGEAKYFRKGPEVIQWADTPYGRIAVSICRDLEMTDFIRQAGKAGVDIMLSSAWEAEEGLTVHSSYLRSVEYGFSLVRPSQHGITIAANPDGKILNWMDYADPGDGIMFADVPIVGINTVYTQIGDILGWVCVVGSFGLVLSSIILNKGKKRN